MTIGDKILVVLDYRAHYPAEYYLMSAQDVSRIKELGAPYGSVFADLAEAAQDEIEIIKKRSQLLTGSLKPVEFVAYC